MFCTIFAFARYAFLKMSLMLCPNFPSLSDKNKLHELLQDYLSSQTEEVSVASSFQSFLIETGRFWSAALLAQRGFRVGRCLMGAWRPPLVLCGSPCGGLAMSGRAGWRGCRWRWGHILGEVPRKDFAISLKKCLIRTRLPNSVF